MKNIRERKIYFGVEREQFVRLKNIKNRFYVGTVGTIELVSSEFHFHFKLLFVVLLVLSQVTDLLIFLFAHREIRAQLRHTEK